MESSQAPSPLHWCLCPGKLRRITTASFRSGLSGFFTGITLLRPAIRTTSVGLTRFNHRVFLYPCLTLDTLVSCQLKVYSVPIMSKRYVKIEVDRDLCIGAAPCVTIAPGVFQLDSENKAIVLDVNGASDDDILLAAQSCPVQAIYLYDAEGNKVYPEV